MTLTGIFAPTPTPFDDRDQIDGRRLQRALARWLRTPLAGFVALGTTSEAALLDDNESDEVIAIARASVLYGCLFVVRTGRESTEATVRTSRRAADRCADAVLVRTPGFFKSQMTSEAFVRRYTAVADVGSTFAVAGLKAALGLIGCVVDIPRPPFAPAPEATRVVLKDALAKFEGIAA